MDAWVGHIIGKYRILDWIGQGGMATVYKAWDLERKRLVALKALFPFLTNDHNFRTRFEREVKILHRLRHPNIIPVLDFGEQDGLLYLVMPYITLGSLRDRLDAGPVSVEHGSKLIRQIASALQFAHDRKVIHRDVKPSNILVDNDFNAWLSDFGFARMHDASLSITGSELIGTPAYMSPEQILGHTTTPSSDQYALGVVLYQLATGHLPYEAETPMGLALKHATEPLPRPRAVNPKLPDAVEEVIVRALSKDANFRYPSVTAFSDAFQAALYAIYDAHTGRLKSGSVGPPPSLILKPVRYALASLTVPAMRSIQVRQTLPWVAGILMLMLPVTALAFTAFIRSKPSAIAQAPVTAAPGVALQGTLHVLESGVALQPEAIDSAAVVETGVAATMAALQSLQATLPVFTDKSAAEAAASATAGFSSTTITPLQTVTSEPTGAAHTSLPPPTRTPSGTVTSSAGVSPTAAATTPVSATNTIPPSTVTATSALVPTTIPTATNPPTDPCSTLSVAEFEREGKTATWTLRNGSGTPQTLTGLRLTWPPGNESLFKVDLSGSTIWVGDELSSPSSISSWIGGVTSRTLTGEQELSFRFKKDAVSGNYALVIETASGCRISR